MGEAYQYVSSYHTLPLNDKDLPAMQTVSVQRYYSSESKDDTRARCKKEREALWGALVKLKVELYSTTFYFPATDVLGKTEEPFYKNGYNRVFAGRGSPMEIRDVLRLAIRAGRIGKGGVRPTLDAYVYDFMTLDCNGFMGNLFNLSPHMHIANWATGDGTKSDDYYDDIGWLEADKMTKGYLPLKPILSVGDITPCDVIITVKRNVMLSMGRFVHIAVVDGISPAGNGKHYVQVVEWGGHGADKHYAPDTFEIIDGPELPGIGKKKDGTPKNGKKLGVGFWEKGKEQENIFRYFFKKPCQANPATWGRFGLEDV